MSAPLDIKICGLSTFEAIDVSIDRGATHLGFVYFEKSPRHVDLAELKTLVDYVQGRAETVVVCVDPDDALIDRFTRIGVDWLQHHGNETPERLAEVKARSDLKIMKAIAVADMDDLDRVEPYLGIADRILLDSKRPKNSRLPGGNGVSFDWRLLAMLDRNVPFMLSGGLDAGNVEEALRVARPTGLDVSSGVEASPGVKDPGRINQFFDAVRRVEMPELQGVLTS